MEVFTALLFCTLLTAAGVNALAVRLSLMPSKSRRGRRSGGVR